ncbi:MAG TPA: HD domain-containing protein [Candidatus Omnitrophota bacterium]|nr:HD domain-containing protein [Candidatus Omnitrophota bacterium]HPT06854.1 HD domain-containing protein [Candidatus Omnitrophota bacterium]
MTDGKRVLIVMDNESVASYLKEILITQAGCLVTIEPVAARAADVLKSERYDIVIAAFGEGGFEPEPLIKSLKIIDAETVIIAYLEKGTPELVRHLFDLGIYDWIDKQLHVDKLLFLVRKGVELHGLVTAQRRLFLGLQEQNVSLQKQNTLLAKRIEESTRNLTRLYEDLRSTYMRTIRVLAQAIDARDHYTHSHSQNVATYASVVAAELHLSAKDLEVLREACELHDLGKIGIQDSILSKPTSLSPQEWEEIRRHPQIGAQILEPLTFLNTVIEMVRQHHEHYDGTGYPEGRRGDDILLGARILHLADAYESMRSARSYRKVPFSKEEAVEEIKRHSGTQFDPKVVEAFLKVVHML